MTSLSQEDKKPKKKRIAVFGGNFNPPTRISVAIVEQLAKEFDKVIVVPCGQRDDKITLNYVPVVHRAVMSDLAFTNISNKVVVDLFDLEEKQFTPSVKLCSKYQSQGDIFLALGADLVLRNLDGIDKRSEMERTWLEGERLWECGHFIVFRRPELITILEEIEKKKEDLESNGEYVAPTLPPNAILNKTILSSISAPEVRAACYFHQDISKFVHPIIENYIAMFELYCGLHPPNRIPFSLPELPIGSALLVFDDFNVKAVNIASNFKKYEFIDNVITNDDGGNSVNTIAAPTIILVFGGDGAMLRAIRQHWRLRIPFFGVNCGHIGHLLTLAPPPSCHTIGSTSDIDCSDIISLFEEKIKEPLVMHHLPMLLCELGCGPQEFDAKYFAFNDVWVERMSGQTCWLEIFVNGKMIFEKFVADGLLVCTAAGSTAYASAMGLSPIPVESKLISLVGSNVVQPRCWRPCYLPLNTIIQIRVLQPEHRPVRGFVDGIPIGNIHCLRVRMSNVASASILFQKEQDIHDKLAILQFSGC